MSSASQAGSEVSILPYHLIISLPAPNARRNWNKSPRQLEAPSSPGRPAGIRPAEHPQTAGHVRDQSLTIESVLQHPRAASEVPLRRGSFRPGSPRFCPAAAGLPWRRNCLYVSPGLPALPPLPGPPRPSLLCPPVLGGSWWESLTFYTPRGASSGSEGEGRAQARAPRAGGLPSEQAQG